MTYNASAQLVFVQLQNNPYLFYPNLNDNEQLDYYYHRDVKGFLLMVAAMILYCGHSTYKPTNYKIIRIIHRQASDNAIFLMSHWYKAECIHCSFILFC